MSRVRDLGPDYPEHLGPARRRAAGHYSPKNSHADIDRLLEALGLSATDTISDFVPNFNSGATFGSSDPVKDITPDAPTGLVLSWGANGNRVFIDVAWTASPDPDADQVKDYEVEVSKGGEEAIFVYTTQTSCRVEPVEPNTTYDVRVRAIGKLGRPSLYLTGQITTGKDTTVPAQVTGLIATSGMKTAVARWDEVADTDVRDGNGTYEVQIATNSSFSSGLRTNVTSGTITSFGDLSTGTTYWFRVRAIDKSGNAGPYSASASTTPGAAGGGDIQAGVITSDHVVTAGLDAAVIKFGTMSGDRITANSMSVDKLTSSTLTSKTITIGSGGTIQIGSTFNGVILDSSGLKMYQGGSNTVFLRADGGTASFTGNISSSQVTSTTITGGTFQTSTSGNRVVIGANANAGLSGLDMYTTSGSGPAMLYATGLLTKWFGVPSSGYPQPSLTINTVQSSSGGNFVLDCAGGTFFKFDMAPSGSARIAAESAILKYPAGSTELQARNSADNGYATLTGIINNVSDRSEKANVQVFNESALSKLRSVPVYRFTMPGLGDDRPFVGPMADELPPEVVAPNGESYSVGSLLGLILKAIQELEERLP